MRQANSIIGSPANVYFVYLFRRRGWSCGGMVLGKHPVPGRPTN